MSNYEDINYRTGSEPRRRRMSRYGEEEPATQSDTRVDIKAEKPAEPAQQSNCNKIPLPTTRTERCIMILSPLISSLFAEVIRKLLFTGWHA